MAVRRSGSASRHPLRANFSGLESLRGGSSDWFVGQPIGGGTFSTSRASGKTLASQAKKQWARRQSAGSVGREQAYATCSRSAPMPETVGTASNGEHLEDSAPMPETASNDEEHKDAADASDGPSLLDMDAPTRRRWVEALL